MTAESKNITGAHVHFYSATKFGSSALGDGQFTDPEHLAIDSDGNFYVTHRKNNNIQVFKPVN